MSITYPLDFPVDSGLARITWGARSVVSSSQSPYTGAEQVQAYTGQWWYGTVSLPPMQRAIAEAFITFLLKLNGMQGTFLFGDPTGETARGVATGTPLINGSSQSGNSLVTDGWTAGVTGILLAGDYLQLGTGTSARLYKNLSAVNSNGSGQATFDIWPSLQVTPSDNQAVIISSPKGLFRLATNDMSWEVNTAMRFGLSFPIRQVV